MDIKKAMMRAKDRVTEGTEMPDVRGQKEQEEQKETEEKVEEITAVDIIESEEEAISLYENFLQGDVPDSERQVIEEILADEKDHLLKLKGLLPGNSDIEQS